MGSAVSLAVGPGIVNNTVKDVPSYNNNTKKTEKGRELDEEEVGSGPVDREKSLRYGHSLKGISVLMFKYMHRDSV